jgi:hypothetical protein
MYACNNMMLYLYQLVCHVRALLTVYFERDEMKVDR